MKKIFFVFSLIICYNYSYSINREYHRKQDVQICDSIIAITKEFVKYAIFERQLYDYTVFVINIVEFNERENIFRYSISYICNKSEIEEVKPDSYTRIDNQFIIIQTHNNFVNCEQIKPFNDDIKNKVSNLLFDDSHPLSGIIYEMALLQIVEQKGNKISKSMHIRMHNAYPEEYSLYYVPDLLIKTIKTEDVLNSSKPDTFFIAPKK